MTNIFKIHPSIGISRLGDSTAEFCLAPETALGLPVQCDNQGRALLDELGNERPIDIFKDSQGRIKRQAARFRVYVYQDANDKCGRELKMGDLVQVYKRQTGEAYHAIVLDIEWTVYLANKKASWYQFEESQGEHADDSDHILRNAAITDATARQRLIIDPGPQTVSYSDAAPRHAEFSKRKNAAFPQSFPPTLSPKNIETLGEMFVSQQDDHHRLVVLGGYGHSGSFKSGLNANSANNDGWFDDISDGPVTAKLHLQHLLDDGGSEQDLSPFTVPVDDPAWVLVTYPGYVPEIDNMITIDDILYDLALREMDYAPEIYGPVSGKVRGSGSAPIKDWNKEYFPYFYRDIWPILCRPNVYQWLMAFNTAHGSDPYSTASDLHGNLDFDAISAPPYEGQDLAERLAHAEQRQYVYDVLRKPGPESLFRVPGQDKAAHQPPLIPQVFGAITPEFSGPSRFLRLTDTQLFFLQQWVDGKFVNEKREGLVSQANNSPVSGSDLDRGVLRSALGGAFCLGKEVCWAIRNPAIYARPYRIKHAHYTPGLLSQPAAVAGANTISDLKMGLEPGDLTKYGALPWQIDFNLSSSLDIDRTYEAWTNNHSTCLSDPLPTDIEKGAFWWAAHRPLEVFLPMSAPFGSLVRNQLPWARTGRRNTADDFQTITAWVALGFIPDAASSESSELVELVVNDSSDNLALFPEHQAQ